MKRKMKFLESNPDIQVISFSNKKETNLDEVENLLLSGKTFCLIGSSGVGKTSLLNKLFGEDRFATKEIRAKRQQRQTHDDEPAFVDTGKRRDDY